MLRRLFAALVALVTPAGAGERLPMTLLVPAYFYPSPAGSDWDRLTAAAASGLPVVAIVNPASGPGVAADANYARVIDNVRRAGGAVLGYLPSSYAGRRVANPSSSCKPANGLRYTTDDILACARRYHTFYTIDGIFVDEMGGEAIGVSSEDVVSFYTRLYNGMQVIDPSWNVIANPGVPVSDLVLSRDTRTADRLVTFEGPAAEFLLATAAPRIAGTRFGAILIETDSAFDFSATLALAAVGGFTDIFATERARPNPYDRLPANWDQQVETLRAFNAARRR